jgi:uncharacterized protein (TIRG00374 family)
LVDSIHLFLYFVRSFMRRPLAGLFLVNAMASFFKKKQVWGIVLAVAILIFLFYDLNLPRMGEIAKDIDYIYLLPVLLCSFLLVLAKALRWKTMAERVRKIALWPTISLYSTGQVLNVVLPALTGQAGRILLLSKNGNLSKTFVFSTIFLEVLFDAAGLIVLMLISSSVFIFPEQYRFVSYIIASVTLSIFLVFYLILHFQEPLGRFGERLIRPRSRRIYLVLRKFFRSFNRGISVMKSTEKLAAIAFYTAIWWGSHIGVVYFLFLAFRMQMPFLAAIIVVIINCLALMIPLTPGNLGSFQLAVVAGLNIFSVSKTEAVFFSFLLYIVDMIPIVILSGFYIFKSQFSLQQIGTDEELAEIEKMVAESDFPVKEDRV